MDSFIKSSKENTQRNTQAMYISPQSSGQAVSRAVARLKSTASASCMHMQLLISAPAFKHVTTLPLTSKPKKCYLLFMYSGYVKQVSHLGLLLFLLSSSLEEHGCVAMSFWTSDMERNGN